MTDEKPVSASSSKRQARKLQIIGVIVLVLGIAGAGMVYWLGTRSADLSGDLSMTGFNKPEERQMEILYGKQGELIEDWSQDLKQPGTQAILIAGFAVVIASGCFYFARSAGNDDAPR